MANAISLIEGTDRIKVVSHSVHAQRARLYLQHQRPDLARRMVRAADYRPGEWVLLKPIFAGYELLKIAKAKRTLDTDRGRQTRRDDYLGRDGDVVEFRFQAVLSVLSAC